MQDSTESGPGVPGGFGGPVGPTSRTRGFSRFGEYVRTGIAIARLDPEAARRAGADPEALLPGLVIAAIAGAAVELGRLHPFLLFVGAARTLGVTLISAGLLFLLARYIFKGTGTFEGVLNPLALSAVVFWPSLVPFAGKVWHILACVWWLVVSVDILRKTSGLTTTQAILAQVLLVMVYAFLAILVFFVFGMAILSLVGMRAH